MNVKLNRLLALITTPGWFGIVLFVLFLAQLFHQPPRTLCSSAVLNDGNISHLKAPHLEHGEVAIVTAVMGSIDQVKLETGPGIFVYDERTGRLPFPRHDINERLRAKYFKTSSHWLHPEFSAYIWVDGAFEIDPTGLRSYLIEELKSADCAFIKHPDRQTIVQESDFVLNQIEAGLEYLRVRYGDEPMKAQVDAYIAEGFPVDRYPLLAGGLFIRRNLPRVNAAFDHWLIENVKWTIQDQLSLPYILWKHNLTFNVINADLWSGPHHKHRGHANPSQ